MMILEHSQPSFDRQNSTKLPAVSSDTELQKMTQDYRGAHERAGGTRPLPMPRKTKWTRPLPSPFTARWSFLEIS